MWPVIADSPRSATRYFALGEKNLFKYDSPEELASRIDYWLDDPEAMERCRRAYEGYSAQFDRDVCMDRMEGMLRDAAATK